MTKRRKMTYIITAIILIPILLIALGYFYGSRHFIVKEQTIYFDNLPAEFDGYRIAQFSDFHALAFHCGHEEDVAEAVKLINDQHCDLIAFTGDLVTMQADELNGFEDQLRLLSAPDGVVSIMGNHDYALYRRDFNTAQRLADIRDLHRRQRAFGWNLLLNDHTIIHRGNDSIAIVGVENDGAARRFPSLGDLPRATKGIQNGTFSILLSHDPTHWRRKVIPETDIDLTLSGHTHAGQFEILGWSPVSFVYKEWSGIYTNEKTDKDGKIITQTLNVSN